MSRVAKQPIQMPTNVQFSQNGADLEVKGPKATLKHQLHPLVKINCADNVLTVDVVEESNQQAWAMAGTTRALIHNMVVGTSEGFEKKLTLVGVGYRVAVQGKKLTLTLGFSHPVIVELPEGVTAEAPSQTDLVLKSADKQLLGQVAANIRAKRPPEPYKGKGVRYADEHVRRKEAKKK